MATGEVLGTIGAILAITGVGFGLLAIALSLLWLFSSREERPPLEPLSIYGEWIALPEEAKAGGKGFAGGRGRTEPTARQNANTDIAHRGEAL